MINCPNCNHQNPDGALQCEACYTPLPTLANCPNCGASIQADASFCGQCGSDLREVDLSASAAPTSAPMAEGSSGGAAEAGASSTLKTQNFLGQNSDPSMDLPDLVAPDPLIEPEPIGATSSGGQFTNQPSTTAGTEISAVPGYGNVGASPDVEETAATQVGEESQNTVNPVEAESAPFISEPSTSEPLVFESPASEPVASEPLVFESPASEPVASEPVVSELVASEPVISAPVISEPVISEPVISEPVVSEPVVSEPVAFEPATSAPQVSEPPVSPPVIPVPSTEPEQAIPQPLTPEPVAASAPPNPRRSSATQLQVTTVRLKQVQTNSLIEIPRGLSIVRIGKPNDHTPPDIDVSGFPDSEIVSRVHANIRVEGDAYYLEDVGSSNGTYINGLPLPVGNRHRLRPGDRIAFGKGDKVSFIFELAS